MMYKIGLDDGLYTVFLIMLMILNYMRCGYCPLCVVVVKRERPLRKDHV